MALTLRFWGPLAIALVAPSTGAALGEEDCEGCRDLPYLSRMPNYYLSRADVLEFDAQPFFDGKKVVSVEGKVSRLTYTLIEEKPRASALQIRRNYANAVKKAGGKLLHDGVCDGEKCGDLDGVEFASGTFKHQGKEIWFTISTNAEGAWYDLIACERGEMKQDVEVTAEAMQTALDADGHIALYINFDTNKATIKPESKPVVDEVVKLLTGQPELKLSIEGHTDDTGDPKKATKLSAERAKAVMAALVKAGVDGKRLKTAGLGAAKPIADNTTDEGRAKNRRVELVKID